MTDSLATELAAAYRKTAQNAATLTVAQALYELARIANDRAITGTDLLAVARRLLEQAEGK